MVGDVAIAPAKPMAARCMIAPGGGGGIPLWPDRGSGQGQREQKLKFKKIPSNGSIF